ncbi:hypothetical protein HY418_02765 [Candidatus Kaiserbacteria bacterium]|nr:hypothetical protein [Candidatus Kaiserbacteria bacterium]
MQKVITFVRNANWFAMSVSVVAGVFFITAVANASSTISTNISTGGTLDVTGAATLSSTLGVTGASTLSSTLGVTGLSTLTGGFVSQASSTVVATTTIVGPGNSAGLVLNTTAISQLLFGTCAVNPGAITASTTVVATCTATGVNTGSKVFVTAASSTNQIVFTSASSTGANTISIALYNIGSPSGDVTPTALTFSWLAIQ